jgi:CDP-diglyceride synthetase
MLTDRFTARVLGGVTIVMTVLIVISCFMFTPPEVSHRSTFPILILFLSLPMLGGAVFFFRRASQLKDSD